MKPVFAALLLALALAGCASSGGTAPHRESSLDDLLAMRGNAEAAPEKFFVCHGYGCRLSDEVSLSPEEWARVAAVFDPPSASPEEERQRLGPAVGMMETLVGPKTGTEGDVYGTFLSPFGEGQMDCEDEMNNTATYFRLFEKQGLIRFHRMAGRAGRGAFVNGWPHMAVTIEDTGDGRRYVLDSWFHDNGVPAEVVEAGRWQSGWKPHNEGAITWLPWEF
jgi:hypothetical protein